MPDTILSEILAWSQQRPLWQRDALRRLLTTGSLGASDIDELVSLCKAPIGLSSYSAPRVLTGDHLAITDQEAAAVSLVSITHHRGVNALTPEQVLSFGPGLTIVYGQNTAGKSGYTRILKRACRSRFTEDILGDVLSGQTPMKAQATIRFRCNGAETPFVWTPDGPPAKALAAVNVFDSHCVPVYLGEKTDVAFRPFGLDVFDRLRCQSPQMPKCP